MGPECCEDKHGVDLPACWAAHVALVSNRVHHYMSWQETRLWGNLPNFISVMMGGMVMVVEETTMMMQRRHRRRVSVAHCRRVCLISLKLHDAIRGPCHIRSISEVAQWLIITVLIFGVRFFLIGVLWGSLGIAWAAHGTLEHAF